MTQNKKVELWILPIQYLVQLKIYCTYDPQLTKQLKELGFDYFGGGIWRKYVLPYQLEDTLKKLDKIIPNAKVQDLTDRENLARHTNFYNKLKSRIVNLLQKYNVETIIEYVQNDKLIILSYGLDFKPIEFLDMRLWIKLNSEFKKLGYAWNSIMRAWSVRKDSPLRAEIEQLYKSLLLK